MPNLANTGSGTDYPRFSSNSSLGNAGLDPLHPARPGPGVLCLCDAGPGAELEHPVPPDPSALTAPERQGRESAEDGAGRVLANGRPEGPRDQPWQHFYNFERPHDSLGGRAPIDRLCDLIHDAPTGEEIAAGFDPAREFFLPRNAWPAQRPRLDWNDVSGSHTDAKARRRSFSPAPSRIGGDPVLALLVEGQGRDVGDRQQKQHRYPEERPELPGGLGKRALGDRG